MTVISNILHKITDEYNEKPRGGWCSQYGAPCLIPHFDSNLLEFLPFIDKIQEVLLYTNFHAFNIQYPIPHVKKKNSRHFIKGFSDIKPPMYSVKLLLFTKLISIRTINILLITDVCPFAQPGSKKTTWPTNRIRPNMSHCEIAD